MDQVEVVKDWPKSGKSVSIIHVGGGGDVQATLVNSWRAKF